jgi:hypothetical protein
MNSIVRIMIYLFLWILILILGVCFLYQPKTLIAICCLDERILELQQCIQSIYRALQFYIGKPDIIGIFREKDILCQSFLNNYLTVPNYETPIDFKSNDTYDRHNMNGILAKRNRALHYALTNGYKRLIFIDSDISIKYTSLYYLLFGTLFADISCIPYGIRWANMKPVLGYTNPHRISFEPGWLPYHCCQVAGMGCTCIALNSKKIPHQFSYAEILGIRGEDIGFFSQAYLLKARIWATSHHLVDHK